MEQEKAKTENLIDQLTVSDDFNIDLQGTRFIRIRILAP